MASRNLFDLLDDDTEDAYAVIAAAQEKLSSSVPAPPMTAAKKKLSGPPAANNAAKPSTQPGMQTRNEGGRGRGGREYGGARVDYSKEKGSLPCERRPEQESTFAVDEMTKKSTERFGPEGYGNGRRGPPGGRRVSFEDDVSEQERSPRRFFERRSGTGRGGEFKRNGAGRGNWGSATDEIVQVIGEPIAEIDAAEKPVAEEENVDAEKEISVKEIEAKDSEQKEPEEKHMTLEEYEKVLEEKRKALLSLTGEEKKGLERKIDVEEFQSMLQLVCKKKNDDEVFIKLGSYKDKRKEAAEKEERARKSVNINEFLKNAGKGYGGRNGRGRGSNRGREGYAAPTPAPAIEDRIQFPGLGVAA